jgi:predicted esterase
MIRIFYAALLLFGWLVGSLLAAPEAEPAVNFLPAPPVIDGVLDAGLRALPARRFPVLDKDDPRNVAPAVTWRVAYGTDFLYLFIEVAADRAIVRDRGYQNGDGFHLVLARPRADGEASDEFYVLGFSAVSDPASFYRQMIWYYNVDLAFRPLDHGTRFEIRSFRGRTGYELLLPWAEVYPYHPWLSEGIGFNLCFVKAEAGGRRTFYALLHDPKIQSEQSPRRYVRLDFQHPALTRGIQSCLVMNRNATAGSIVAVRVATLAAAPGEERIRVRIRSGEGEVLDRQVYPLECPRGLAVHEIGLPTTALPPGGYGVEWLTRTGPPRGEIGLTVLPAIVPQELGRRLQAVGSRISAGSRTTLEFRRDELQSWLVRRKPYDTAAGERMEMNRFLGILARAEAGEDVLARQRGIFRRAFRSRQDGTLQPYSVYIPPDFDPERTYPLLVFLHGSGQDDREQLEWLEADPPELIAIAPFGRGISNFYLTREAQTDIQEAIEDARRNYPIDPGKTVLAGFSMGGYGVYRTFAETPSRFQALAVFSGRPNLGRHAGYEADDPVDFLQPEQLRRFRDMPMFIVHGRQDMNCPFADTERMVAGLKAAGARVEFHVDETEGHSSSTESRREFLAWCARVLNRVGEDREAPEPSERSRPSSGLHHPDKKPRADRR